MFLHAENSSDIGMLLFSSLLKTISQKCQKKNPDHLYKIAEKNSRMKADHQALSGIPDNLISDWHLTSLNACLRRYRDREYHRKLSSRSYAALENMLTI